MSISVTTRKRLPTSSLNVSGRVRFLVIGFLAVLVTGCCAILPSGVLFEPSPSIQYFNGGGEPIIIREDRLRLIDVYSVRQGDSVPVVWEVVDVTTNATVGPEEGNRLDIVSGNEFGRMPQGDRRRNELVIRYEYQGYLVADTLWYDSRVKDNGCSTKGIIDPIDDIRGPLVDRFERMTNFPGVRIYLRDSL